VEAPGEDPAQVDHFVARCPKADGKLGRGACTMTSNIVPSATRFKPGPAELVIRMFRSDGANLVMLHIRRLPIYFLAI
jgi:hypothetical protein